jgi:FkbM family methyltransferase
VVLIPKALGARSGELAMQIANFSQISTVNPEFVTALKGTRGRHNVTWSETRQVRVTTLDDLIIQFGLPAFIKIDVEGFEHQVLYGLSRAIPACAFEFQPHYLTSALESIAHLEQLGGAVYNYYIEEEMKLRLTEWVRADEMLGLLKSFEHTDAFLMGEVYARMA